MEHLLDFLKQPFIFDGFSYVLSKVSSIYGIAGFLIYVIGCYMAFGFTKSISITYYLLPSAKHDFLISHNLRWLFQLFMFASAFSIFCIAQNVWYFIVAASFTLMAFFPSVLYKNFIIPHCTFATLGISLMSIGLPVCYGIQYIWVCVSTLVACILIALFVNQKPDTNYEGSPDDTTKLYWIEITSISMSIIGLIFAKIC